MNDRRPPGSPRAGGSMVLDLLIPGRASRSRRGVILAGWFATAILVGGAAWGTSAGLALLGFAYLVHLLSAVDALRRTAFPGFRGGALYVSASVGLGLGLYLPAIAVASVFAWPAFVGGELAGRVLVNRASFASSRPRAGDRVWVDDGPGRAIGPALVLSGPAEEASVPARLLRWAGDRSAMAPAAGPSRLDVEVPEGQVLVLLTGPEPSALLGGFPRLRLVPRGAIVGGVWGHPGAGEPADR